MDDGLSRLHDKTGTRIQGRPFAGDVRNGAVMRFPLPGCYIATYITALGIVVFKKGILRVNLVQILGFFLPITRGRNGGSYKLRGHAS